MTIKSHKKAFIQNTIEEALACISFIFIIWIMISWVGVLGEQALPDWNFFKILIELMLNFR